jgi:hypothetical protein
MRAVQEGIVGMTEPRSGFWPEEREPEVVDHAALRVEEWRATLLRWVEELPMGARLAFRNELWEFQEAVREEYRQRMKGAGA